VLQVRDLALVALGGAVGSLARYAVGRVMGPQADVTVPWHTFAVNVTGAFAIGLLLVVAARSGWPGWWRPLIAVGVLGGYTTFSTYSLEVVELALRGNGVLAAGYALGSLAMGVAACGLGIALGRSLT
jgi:CrcB protein